MRCIFVFHFILFMHKSVRPAFATMVSLMGLIAKLTVYLRGVIFSPLIIRGDNLVSLSFEFSRIEDQIIRKLNFWLKKNQVTTT